MELVHVYTKAPRPVQAVIFFGNGRFRRMREGVLASDPEQLNDPSIMLRSAFGLDKHFDDKGGLVVEMQNREYTLEQDGKVLAHSDKLHVHLGRRRPDLRVYILQ